MKSGPEGSFYVPGDGPGQVLSTRATAGPWSASAQHGGPPSGLLARAVGELLEPGQAIGRIAIDLLGPVPVGPLTVTTSVLRPGRQVSLVEATLRDDTAGRDCAVARAWVLPRSDTGPGSPQAPTHGPQDGTERPLPPSWKGGYVHAVEWRWIKGAVLESGPAVVWMRSTVPLLPGEELRGVPLLMTCVDSASGASAILDPAEWSFMNTDLTVHVIREPVGEWVCVEAETTLTSSAVGVCTSTVYDELGVVAKSAQALLVVPVVAPAG